jgi:hypothetical protein
MRDTTKVVVGFGCIWGLLSLCGIAFGTLTMGENDSLPEGVALLLYGFTILPACLLAIKYPRHAAYWLLALAPISAFGFIYQAVKVAGKNSHPSLAQRVCLSLLAASIPAVLGTFLMRSEADRSGS